MNMIVMSEERIAQFLNNLRESTVDCHAVAIMQDGKVIFSRAYEPFDINAVHPVYSVTKSFTSMAIGILVSAGKLKLEETWLSYFPEYRDSAARGFEKVTVRNLLTMTCGHDAEPVIRGGDDWIQDIISKPLAYEPGRYFLYNSMSSHLLSCLVERLTGKRLDQFLSQRLFKPLGISKWYWDRDLQGHSTGGFGLHLTVSDLAKFGEMLLEGGRYGANQVIPADWIKEAASLQVQTRDQYQPGDIENRQGYGYQIWMCTHHGFRCSGMNGQLCFVQPENKLVVAVNSAATGSKQILDCLFDAMYQPPKEQTGIDCSIPAVTGRPWTDAWPKSSIAGHHRADPNCAGIQSLSIRIMHENELHVSLQKDNENYSFSAGYGKWTASSDHLRNLSPLYWHEISRDKIPVKYQYQVFGNYAWTTAATMMIRLRELNNSAVWNICLRLDGDSIVMSYQVSGLYTKLPVFEAVFQR